MFQAFLFHRWHKTILRVVNWLLGLIFLGLLAYKFKVYNTIDYPFSHHKDYRIDGTFFPYIFFLILIYFYFLFTEWLIKKVTTYQISQTQFLQVLQEKKLVVEGQEYLVEKIDKLKISFYPQTVNYQGILIIPQEDSYLKLNFSINTSWDYYNQYLLSPLQAIAKQIGKKSFSLIWIFFHLILLTFFFGYLFIVTPKLIEEAQRRNQKTDLPVLIVDDKTGNYRQRLSSEPFPPEIKKKILKEILKLERMNPWGSNRDVQEEYIEKLMSLPWWQTTPENKDLAQAQAELDQAHFGLEKVKERIIEYLAGQQKGSKRRFQTLCLVGPAGTGKTSLGQSIAKATGRKFVKVSVGGAHDEGEIRGHRRVYVGAGPGRIIQGINKARVVNPLLLIDEIDKMVNNVYGLHGNPVAALLEVLDPEQNENFNDNYLGQEIPYDLSKVMFICTANVLENIPGPLRDRMDVVQLPPYTTLDKIQIAKNHSIPKIFSERGLEKDQLTFTDEAIEEIISFYTLSGGVRDAEKIFRRIADKFFLKNLRDNLKSETIDLAKVHQYLGPRETSHEDLTDYSQSGVVNGLAWTEVGGVILPVEASCLPAEGKHGKLIEASGNLGKIMNESAKVAYLYVRANYRTFAISETAIKENDVFLHFPEGAISKDGPSAGIAITTAIISALKGKAIPRNYGMTGEITSKGKVCPIGGLREKLTAAYEHKLKTVFIPRENKSHLDEIPFSVKSKLEIIPVDNYLQIWDKILTSTTD